jgi:predicted Rossmann-fold nucleotide-binding protein
MDIHQKPIALYNIDGFYDDLVAMLQKTADLGFAPEANLDLFINGHDLDEIFAGFHDFKHVLPPKYTN